MEFLKIIAIGIQRTGIWVAIGLGIYFKSFLIGIGYLLVTLVIVALIGRLEDKKFIEILKNNSKE